MDKEEGQVTIFHLLEDVLNDGADANFELVDELNYWNLVKKRVKTTITLLPICPLKFN